ncbi:uncharacterized protein UHOD_12161 [Ustilago sp. UG-2017b]|nr:uncharacterized protein UHOD_12161 [Ustilago sp. UG-2017b]
MSSYLLHTFMSVVVSTYQSPLASCPACLSSLFYIFPISRSCELPFNTSRVGDADASSTPPLNGISKPIILDILVVLSPLRGFVSLSTQVAWRLLVHRGGAQVPRLGSQKKTTIAGLGMVEQEARGLAGTGSRHGRNATSMESATSMETMDMEDQAVCMEVQAPPQGGPGSRSIQMVTT